MHTSRYLSNASLFKTSAALLLMCLSLSAHTKHKLVSMSVYSDLNQDFFVAALHSTQDGGSGLYDNSVERQIEIRIATEKMFSRQFSRIWVNGSAINNQKSDFYQNTKNIIEFSRCIKGSLEKGDIVLIDYHPENGTSLLVNGVFIHTFAEPSFFNMLLNVLIGDVPLSTRMKEELTLATSKNIPNKIREVYDSLSPSTQRIAAIKNVWMTPPSTERAQPEEESQPAPVAQPKATQQPNTSKPSTTIAKINKEEKHAEQKKNTPAESTPVPISERTIAQPSETSITKEEYIPFTMDSLVAEREFLKEVNEWVTSYTSYPILVAERPEKDSIRFTITINQNGELINYRQYEKSKYAALNKGAVKVIKKSAPYPKIPAEIKDNLLDLDLYFHLHWRYRQ